MKISKITRIEFLVLVLLLFSFFFVLTPEEEKKALATTHYIDSNNTAPGSGTIGDPWACFDYIDWTQIGTGDTINVIPGTYNPQYPIVIQDNNITITSTSVYSRPIITDYNMSSGTNMVVLDYNYNCNYASFNYLTFQGNQNLSTLNIVNINGQNGNEITNSTFYGCKFIQDNYDTFRAYYADNLTIKSTFEFTTDNSFSYTHVILEYCDDFDIEDSDLFTEHYCSHTINSFLDVVDCDTGFIARCNFYTHDTGMARVAVNMITSTDIEFRNNTILGRYTDAGFLDADMVSGIFNHNTISIGCPDDANNGAHGYLALRSATLPISSFRNNILEVASWGGIQSFPLNIYGTPYDWLPPSSAMCDFNNYYDSASSYVVNWCGTYLDLPSWQYIADANSYNLNPYLLNGRVQKDLTPNTPNEILGGGIYLGSSVLDIDSGMRDPNSVTIGCDQISSTVITASGGATYMNGILILGNVSKSGGSVNVTLTIDHYGACNFQIASFLDLNYPSLFYSIPTSNHTPTKVAVGSSHNIVITFDPTNAYPGYDYYSTLNSTHTHSGYLSNSGWMVDRIQLETHVVP